MQESLFQLKLQACNFIKKENLVEVFSCEFCEIFKYNFSYRTYPVAASIYLSFGVSLATGDVTFLPLQEAISSFLDMSCFTNLQLCKKSQLIFQIIIRINKTK